MADVIKTIGSGGDYTTLQAWANDIQSGTGYSAGDVAIGRLIEDYVHNTGDHALVLKNKHATNAISKAILEPAPGNEHDGDPTAGYSITNGNAAAGFNVIMLDTNADYDVEIRDLVLIRDTSSGSLNRGSCVYTTTTNSGIEVLVKRVICQGSLYQCADVYAPYGIRGKKENTIVVRCLVYDFNNAQTAKGIGVASCKAVYNTTVYNSGQYGLYNNYDSTIVRNCIIMDSATSDYFKQAGSWGGGTDKNMSSDTTAPGSTTYQSEVSTSIWTDPANDDFTLKPSTNAVDTGDTLTSYDNDIDIENDTVTGAYDLGAYETFVIHTVIASKIKGADMGGRQQNSTSYPVLFFMADETDLVTGETGLSPTVTISKNQGAFGAASGSVAEVGGGWYALAGNATDRNTLGELAIHATATGAAAADVKVDIVSHDPFDISGADAATVADAICEEAIADHSGTAGSVAERLSRIPNVAPAASGGLPTVDASNRIAGIVGTVVNTLDEIAGSTYVEGTHALDQVASTADLAATMFTTDSGQTYSTAVAGSAVKETATGGDFYWAMVDVRRDSSQDEYTVTWMNKNAVVSNASITSPTLQVVKRADGTDLIAQTALTQIGSTDYYKLDEAVNRLTLGEAAVAVVAATIGGSSRTWAVTVGRDVAT